MSDNYEDDDFINASSQHLSNTKKSRLKSSKSRLKSAKSRGKSSKSRRKSEYPEEDYDDDEFDDQIIADKMLQEGGQRSMIEEQRARDELRDTA